MSDSGDGNERATDKGKMMSPECHLHYHLSQVQPWVNGTTALWVAVDSAKARGAHPNRNPVQDGTGSRQPQTCIHAARAKWSSHPDKRQQGDSAAALDDGAALFRECTAPPRSGEGPRKGGLYKACFTSILPACRGWLDIHLCGRKRHRSRKIYFGAWNVRTLMDADQRPERMTAIVGHELARYNIAIAALSETRRADTGSVREMGVGYTFFWSGKMETEPRVSGVGFAIRNDIASCLTSLPKGISDRIMTLRLPLASKTHLTLIGVYAPTMTHSMEEREAFYSSLRKVIRSVPSRDKLLLLGDFNARVGRNKDAWPGELGSHGYGRENSNGLLLLSLCAEENLVITNTVFKHKDAHKVTWMHPRSKHWHLLDYIITRQQDLGDILDTRALRGADCWTDHILLRCRALFTIHKSVKKKPSCIKRKLDVSQLKCSNVQKTLQEQLCEQLPALPVDTDTPEHAWRKFREAVFSAAETTLSFYKCKHQDWFDQNNQDILTLIEAKRSAHAAWLSDKNSAPKHAQFKQLRRQVQSRTRELKNAWWADKAAEVQDHANENRTKEFYDGLKSIFGPVQCKTAPIRNRDGMLLTDKEDILKQWTLHFSTLLNQTLAVADEALEGIQQRPIILELDAPPNTAETVAAVKQLQTSKVPGPDGIPAEVFKAGGEALITHLTRLFQVFWANGKLPQDFRDANIIHLYKNKDDRSSCDNHCGISLLSIAGKILARTLLNRITKHILDDMVSESQCGFRQIQEKCVEQHQDLHLLFIDLTKAFDTVNRPALWAILSKLGCPPRFVEIIRSFHDGMLGRVIENGDASEPFPVANGVKQGCVLAPTLFSLLFAQMLSAALAQTSAGVTVHYRTDGDFFNIRRLKAHSKVRQAVVRDFLFADDCALAAHSEEDLQELLQPTSMMRFCAASPKLAGHSGVFTHEYGKSGASQPKRSRAYTGLCWKDREPNKEILRRAGLTGIEAMLSQSQLRWSGHVTRMDDSRLPKQLFHAELSTGKRHRSGQRKRYKDSLKSTLKSYNIPVDGWQAMALDRPKWRATIREGKEIFENCRLQRLDEKRQARKTRVPDPSTAVSCDLCARCNPSPQLARPRAPACRTMTQSLPSVYTSVDIEFR
ncbi:uncharacterized protein LOC134762738 [Penaeus indicus]|uniref:uncharacterized protein LOC134762738 n=1 Tax=Penaeus indicus TaxID=29960 RepID=UPI00300CD9CD